VKHGMLDLDGFLSKMMLGRISLKVIILPIQYP